MTLNTIVGDQETDSYITVDEFKAYAIKYGHEVSGTNEEIEQACRRGTRWIDVTYGNGFIGKTATIEQSLEWPRIKAMWRGEEIDSAIIPNKIKNAAYEAIRRELSNPNSLSPDYVQAEAVKQETVGDLSVTYQDGKGTIADVTPIVSIVDNILVGFIVKPQKGVLFGSCARA